MAGTVNDIYADDFETYYVDLTTDATPKILKELNVSPLEGGFLEVYCTGVDKLGNFVSGVKFCRYKKDTTGVITLGTVTTVLPVQADAGISTATFNIVVSNNNIAIQVTGVAGKNIGWNMKAEKCSISMINF